MQSTILVETYDDVRTLGLDLVGGEDEKSDKKLAKIRPFCDSIIKTIENQGIM